jgi:hypothetical protein
MQVQQLVLGTFLTRDWRSAEYLADVPAAFVAEAVVNAAQAWVSHKGVPLQYLCLACSVDNSSCSCLSACSHQPQHEDCLTPVMPKLHNSKLRDCVMIAGKLDDSLKEDLTAFLRQHAAAVQPHQRYIHAALSHDHGTTSLAASCVALFMLAVHAAVAHAAHRLLN